MNGKTKCVGMCVYGDGRKMIKNNTVIPKASYFICMQQYCLPHLQHCPRCGSYGRWVQGGARGWGAKVWALLGV